MKKYFWIYATVVIIILGLWTLHWINLNGSGAGSLQMQNSSSESVSGGPQQGVLAIAIKNFTFSPTAVTIKVGTTVTWTNQDSVTHSVESDAFDSGDLDSGQTFTYTFAAPGIFNYHCGRHPFMTGKIIVQ